MIKTTKKKGQSPYNELHLKLFAARKDANREREEKERLQELLSSKDEEIRTLLEQEQIRLAKRKAAWILALKLALLGLFAFGCTISAIASFLYAPWWTAIAPVALLILGSYKSLMG